jgi:DNA-binding SARP family transcriptional activator
MLAYLRRQDLFVVDLGQSADGKAPESTPDASLRLRYHNIFHDFLRQASTAKQRAHWHSLAAEYFESDQDYDPAIYHRLQAQDTNGAARLLEAYGPQLLNVGRLDTLTSYLDALPPSALRVHPALLSLHGDLARLHSRFQEALAWYQQAETVCRQRGLTEGALRALRGQARVYLDTVNPSKAEEILQQTIRLSDGIEDRESQARLYELLAENRLNAGRVEDAERLRQQAEALRIEAPSDSQLLLRVLLRTGRLKEARQKLEVLAETERSQPVHTPRAHRETLLLLSLVYSLLGMGEQALQSALEGTRRGTDLHSPFINAVGHIRQGHALMLLNPDENFSSARRQFERTVEISQQLAVPRLLAETYWGLCRSYGYQGDIPQALSYAQRAVEISSQAGDEWVASLARLAMGSGLAQVERLNVDTPHPRFGLQQAEEWLNLALRGFQECSDVFGEAITRIWLCQTWLRRKDIDEQQRISLLEAALPRALASCRQNEFDFLFTRPTLLGPTDERLFTPLLILARNLGWETAYAEHLLAELDLVHALSHPGYRLRIQTLGSFQVWRGLRPIPSSGWRREKARQLFQVLITFRRTPLDRDQIIEFLWPSQDPAAAQRSFKVALNTLFQVLEPERDPGSESSYIFRDGSLYGLRPGADLWIDAQELLELYQQASTNIAAKQSSKPSPIKKDRLENLHRALALYQGEYLPDARYETWAAAERERIAVAFLHLADQLASTMLEMDQPQESIEICHRILDQDSCWERAYRMLMLAYHQLGDRGQVARAYQRCLHALHQDLDVEPSPETQMLYHQLTHSQ